MYSLRITFQNTKKERDRSRRLVRIAAAMQHVSWYVGAQPTSSSSAGSARRRWPRIQRQSSPARTTSGAATSAPKPKWSGAHEKPSRRIWPADDDDFARKWPASTGARTGRAEGRAQGQEVHGDDDINNDDHEHRQGDTERPTELEGDKRGRLRRNNGQRHHDTRRRDEDHTHAHRATEHREGDCTIWAINAKKKSCRGADAIADASARSCRWSAAALQEMGMRETDEREIETWRGHRCTSPHRARARAPQRPWSTRSGRAKFEKFNTDDDGLTWYYSRDKGRSERMWKYK